MDDSQIRNMISYVIKYLNRNCPENLDTMIHLIGHDERYRKRVEEITEAIIENMFSDIWRNAHYLPRHVPDSFRVIDSLRVL